MANAAAYAHRYADGYNRGHVIGYEARSDPQIIPTADPYNPDPYAVGAEEGANRVVDDAAYTVPPSSDARGQGAVTDDWVEAASDDADDDADDCSTG